MASELNASFGAEHVTISAAGQEIQEWVKELKDGYGYGVQNPENNTAGNDTLAEAGRVLTSLGKAFPGLTPQNVDKISF
jgi:hypothetical protein